MTNKIYGLLGLCARSGNLALGMEAVSSEIKKNKIELIIVAEDTSQKTIDNIKYLANQKNIEVIIFGNIEENSKSIGKVNKAIIGIKDKNIAKEIRKIICGGEAFGKN